MTMGKAEYPEEIWLCTPWPDHPKDVSRLWTQDKTKDGAVRYVREDLVPSAESKGASDAATDG